MDDISTTSFFITLVSIIFIYIINTYASLSKYKFYANLIFLSEAITLSFFFGKFPLSFSLILFIVSSYYTIFSNDEGISKSENSISYKALFDNYSDKFFLFLGLFLILSILVYESLANKTLSSNGLLVFILSLLSLVYKKIDVAYRKEYDFIFLFILMLTTILIFPTFAYKIWLGEIGSNYKFSLLESSFLVEYFLVIPVTKLLNVVGLTAIHDGAFIMFENQESGLLQRIEIAKSCSGIASIQIFCTALITYLIIELREINLTSIIILLYGLFFSYVANILRMVILIISGHYWGMDVLLFLHTYLGWLIFTLWIGLFWYFFERKMHLLKKEVEN